MEVMTRVEMMVSPLLAKTSMSSMVMIRVSSRVLNFATSHRSLTDFAQTRSQLSTRACSRAFQQSMKTLSVTLRQTVCKMASLAIIRVTDPNKMIDAS